MKKISLLLSALCIAAICFAQKKDSTVTKKDRQKDVLMQTTMGDMIIRLSDSTPLHRDNFLKLVKVGFYDSLLFHRVMTVSYTHLRAHETVLDLVCRLLLEKKK